MRRNIGLLAAALVSAGLLAAPAADAATLAPHEKTYTAPGGVEFTVGHRDHAVRPAPSLNGMPTNRDLYVDNTFYGRINAGTGTLSAGYLVACAVDLTAELNLGAEIGVDADLRAGVSIGPESVLPGLDVDMGPYLGAGIGVDLSLSPGTVVDLPVGEHPLHPGDEGYLFSRDRRIHVEGCGGPLTVQPYVFLTVDAAEVRADGAVFGDPFTL
ncbi:MspA family porin [Nocardia farcinica]|uniref:MspA n=1 Tax=Nocardia farcinica (strain IFM 10152) TaxID=247156 RepID=Q5Z1E5_NOCFA|nr:MspA family porin [Nocardia farcinica]BAD55746.1 hypothetical protein NFA_9010 [Nocardia farcinica IFM 10152]